MKRSRIALISVTIMLLLSGCGDTSENNQSTASISDETNSAENITSDIVDDFNEQFYFDALTPNELATGIYRLSWGYYFDENYIKENNQVIHSVIDENDGFGSEILTTYPQFKGMEYLIAFDNDNAIGQLYVYRPLHENYGIGCYGEIQNINELGVSNWNELVELYRNGIPDNQNNVLTKEFSINDFTDAYDKSVVPTITLTGNTRAIENFRMGCRMDRRSSPNIPNEGRLGAVYDFSTRGNVESIMLTFDFNTDLLFISDLSDDTFLPAIYYYDDETFSLIEVENQTRFENSVSAPLNQFGTYLLMNKIEADEFIG